MSRPLNFLHLTTFYPPYSFGGDAMYLYRLSHALGEAGHHVDIIHCIDAYQLLHPTEPEMKFEGHPNVTPHGLQTGYGWLSPLFTHQTGRSGFKRKHITHFLNNKLYDVMHYHNISLLGPEVLTLEPHQSRVVKMYTAHEHWLICPMHVLWKYNKRLCDKPDCIRCMILSRRPPQIWRYTNLLKKTSQHVDQFVSPSRFTAMMHAERGFLMLRQRNGELKPEIARGIKHITLVEKEFEFSRTIVRRVVESCQAVLTTNAQEDPRFENQVSSAAYQLRSIICAPLRRLRGSPGHRARA